MKKIITKLLLIALVFSLSTPVAFAYNTTNWKEYPTKWQEWANDDKAEYVNDPEWQEAIEKAMLEEFGPNYEEIITRNERSSKNADKIRDLFSTDKDGNTLYPDFIGGLYINTENDLVVQIVKENIPSRGTKDYSLYTKVFSISDSIITEYVKYSYNELDKVRKVLDNYFEKNHTDGNITHIADNVFDNTIEVGLKKYSKEEISKFKKTVIDSPLITFQEGQEYIETINPGDSLAGNCSWAYRAYINENNMCVMGMVTAAHCATGSTVSGVGTVKRWQYGGSSPSIDAAWVQTTNTLTNNIVKSGLSYPLSTSVSTLTSGQWVGKRGLTTGYTVGTVQVTNMTGTFTNPKTGASTAFSGMVRTNANNNGGDSGGVVFGGSTSNHTTAGVVKACMADANKKCIANTMIYTVASKINSTFGLTRY